MINPGASGVGKVNQRLAIVNRRGETVAVQLERCVLLESGAAFGPLTDEMESLDGTIEILKRGGSQFVTEIELKTKLEEKRTLRVKLGVDPTSPDLHLGHSVSLFKLRQFQDMGHLGVLIIGDFTSMVGDPTGRSSTRPMLTRSEVMINAETYMSQAFTILDPGRTEILYNSEWLGKMSFLEVVKLNGRVTLQQMLQRDDFKARMEAGLPIFLHELQYPIMQGWDSVVVRADVELGGTDQLFNIMVGRELQKEQGQSPQVACLQPILEGLNGGQKMSKSLGNYIGICEAPKEMFGKVMSISDELMARYYQVFLSEKTPGGHPMEAKRQLAFRIVEKFHDRSAAQLSLEDFNLRFAKRDLDSAELPEVPVVELGEDVVSAVVTAYSQGFGLVKSRSEARRLVEQGSVQWRGEKITNPKARISFTPGEVLKLDKTRAVRLI